MFIIEKMQSFKLCKNFQLIFIGIFSWTFKPWNENSSTREIYWASDKEFDFIRLLFACMKIGWAFKAEIVSSFIVERVKRQRTNCRVLCSRQRWKAKDCNKNSLSVYFSSWKFNSKKYIAQLLYCFRMPFRWREKSYLFSTLSTPHHPQPSYERALVRRNWKYKKLK